MENIEQFEQQKTRSLKVAKELTAAATKYQKRLEDMAVTEDEGELPEWKRYEKSALTDLWDELDSAYYEVDENHAAMLDAIEDITESEAEDEEEDDTSDQSEG